MSSPRTVTDEAPSGASACWCCGMVQPDERLVHLGNHPEVAVCIRCAYSIKNWAWEIEDRSRTSPLAAARDRFRVLRREVVRRGWHQSPLIGRPLRRLGRFLP